MGWRKIKKTQLWPNALEYIVANESHTAIGQYTTYLSFVLSTTSHKSQAEGGTSIFLFPTFNMINTISTPKKKLSTRSFCFIYTCIKEIILTDYSVKDMAGDISRTFYSRT